MILPAALDRLVAIEEIRGLRARYFRFVDTRDWPGFAGLFADNSELSFPDDVAGLVLRGSRNIADAVSTSLVDVRTVHHGHMGEIEFIAADRATGIWPMEDQLWFGPQSAMPNTRLHGYGHYYDDYVRADGQWRFSRVVLRRLRLSKEVFLF
jgi:hypothetical protein